MDRIPLVPYPEGERAFTHRDPEDGGLGLSFHLVEGQRVEATWTVTEALEGWPGLLHGGGHAALHDEAAGWAMVALAGRTGFTRGIELDFERPVPLGDEITVVARVGDLGECEGTFPTEVHLPDGTVASRATSTYAFVDGDRLADMLGTDLSPALSRWLEASPEERVDMVEHRRSQAAADRSDPKHRP